MAVWQCVTEFKKNPSWYQKIPASTIVDYRKEFFNIIDRAYFIYSVTKNTRGFLKVNHPVTPTFYGLLKTHKSLSDSTERPIISGIGCLTYKAKSLIDYLRPHVESLSTYLKDTIHLLTILEGLSVPMNTILASINMEALYSSIAHTRGISVTATFLSERYIGATRFSPQKIPNPPERCQL